MIQVHVGQTVEKVSGQDYTCQGIVVAVFQKRSGLWRVVIEDDRGELHIFTPEQLEELPPEDMT